jgi:hypothetical protein
MLSTTPSPPTQLSFNHSSVIYSTPAIDMAAGSQFGMIPIIVIGVFFAIATTLGNLMVMVRL